jgi:hypothetical protein
MHAELLSSLAAEHRRDLSAGARRHRVVGPGHRQDLAAVSTRPARPDARHAALGRPLPGLRISWSRTSLAGATGRGRSRSWVIVISATRTL